MYPSGWSQPLLGQTTPHLVRTAPIYQDRPYDGPHTPYNGPWDQRHDVTSSSPLPVNIMTDTHFWKHYLPWRSVMILPFCLMVKFVRTLGHFFGMWCRWAFVVYIVPNLRGTWRISRPWGFNTAFIWNSLLKSRVYSESHRQKYRQNRSKLQTKPSTKAW